MKDVITNISWDVINDYLDKDLLICQKHPYYDIWILNYSRTCQFTKQWDNITLSCRGLIVDSNGDVIARSFKKFFNYEELDESTINMEIPYEIFDKMDGSLGIFFYYMKVKEWIFASRGSFISDQAISGYEMISEKITDVSVLDKNNTYIFEIIYPENKIVVDYGDLNDLILLGVIDTFRGVELSYDEIFDKYSHLLTIVNKVPMLDGIDSLLSLKVLEEDNKEGFVIKFENGYRIKIKFDEYVRLHRIVTNISNLSVWKHLKDNGDFNVLLTNVPDEFYGWLNKTINEFTAQYLEIERRAIHEFVEIFYISEIKDKKDFAEKANKSKYRGILFCLFNNNKYDSIIWKQIRPIFTKIKN